MSVASLVTTPLTPRQRLVTAATVAVIAHVIGLAILVVNPPQRLPLTIDIELVLPERTQSATVRTRRAQRPRHSSIHKTQMSSRVTKPASSSTAEDTVPPSQLRYRGINPRPHYPLAARRRGMQGRVLLSVMVNEEGKVAHLFIKQSCGYRLLDEAALRAVRQWRFQPASRLGRSVSATVEIPIRFVLQGNRVAQY